MASLKIVCPVLAALLVASVVSAQEPAASSNADPHIVLAGDSTVTDNAGWGGWFAKAFKSPAGVTNLSRGGRSSISFIAEGRWEHALKLKPDYVLIQFGHNDQPGHGPERETQPRGRYRQTLIRYVDEARAAGATPVLVTPISRREWDRYGRIDSSLAEYAHIVREVAAEKNVPLIDLHDRSIDVYLSLGREGCEKFIAPTKEGGKFDGTHLNDLGGRVFGAIMADELRRVIPELQRYYQGVPHADPKPGADTAPNEPQNLVTGVAPAELGSDRTITVAIDGSGDYRSIQEAIAAVPDHSEQRTTIHIKPGIYYGQIVVARSKRNVTFLGDDAQTTILTYGLNVHDPVPPGVSRYFLGTGTVVTGEGFHAKNITFRNTSGDHGQAMAMRIESDRAVLENCRLLGWQDTLLAHSNRQYFKGCHIEGRVDFIYGGSTAVFENCEIKSKNGGYITAASTKEEQPFGYVFLNCKLTSDDGVPTYFGRPWRPYAGVAYINCEMGDHIRPEGWHNWGKAENEKTARYAEYNSTGPGANPAARVSWSKQLSDAEARMITAQSVLAGEDGWDPTSRQER